MKQISDKSGVNAGLLFLVWPFLALISAFRNYETAWGKNILWAFSAFYGLCFAIGAESQGSDIVGYVEELAYLHTVEMDLATALNYFQESGEIDILRTLIAVVLSRFTGSQAVLTLVYGIIFGFFFSRNVWFVLERLEGKVRPLTILLLACYLLILPIWKINGFRMWTAAHIYIYGLLLFLFEEKKKGVLISATAILVHFSFIVPVGILFGYLLMGNRLVLYFSFFMMTFFLSEIDIETFNKIVESYAPEIIQERTDSYRSESEIEEFREGEPGGKRWYAVWYGRALKWSVIGFLIVLFFKGKAFFRNNRKWLNLFSFVLLFYGVSNLLSSIPSGGRFYAIAEMISLALIILYIQNREQGVVMKRFVWAATPALLLYVVVAVRVGLYSMSATAFLGNPVIAFFLAGEHLSLNDVMRMII